MKSLRPLLAAAVLLAACPSGAFAAPQILGIMASQGPIPLNCGQGRCSAEVTAFCLQEVRAVPPEATPYETVGTQAISIVLYRAQAQPIRLPASAAALASARGFTALTVSVPESLLRNHGAVRAAVEIADGATVAPVPVAGDPRPQSADEVALAAGPIRAFATQRLEQGPVAAAARLTERLINALPPKDLETPAVRNALWDTALGTAAGSEADGAALARQAYDGCQGALATGYMANLRYCLEQQHAAMMVERNQIFWREAGAGS